MKKLVTVFLATVVALSMFLIPAHAEDLTFGYITPGPDTWYLRDVEGFQAAAMFLSRLGSGLPSYGSGMEMDAMGAVVIGGTPITGGKGSIGGTLCGVLLIGLISNSLNMMHVNAFWQDIASGMLIILALAISAFRLRLAAVQQAEAAKGE